MSNLQNYAGGAVQQFGSNAVVPEQHQQEAVAVVIVKPNFDEASNHNAKAGRMSFGQYCEMQADL